MVDPNDQKKRQDFEDQQNELAGRETGRMTRFGVGAALAQELKEKERKERAYRDALDRLLATDPEYRRLYEELGGRLGKAETAADQTIDAIQDALRAQQDANQDMRDRAPRVDGKAIFRYADGRVVDEDSNEIDATIAAGIIWPEDAPSAEDYFAGVERENALWTALDEWQAYRDVTLGGIRDSYDDRDNPMTKDDMQKALQDIAVTAPSNPLAQSSEHLASAPLQASAVAVPSLAD
mgnify:CR=1 FL=1